MLLQAFLKWIIGLMWIHWAHTTVASVLFSNPSMPKRRCTRKDWERNQASWAILVPMKRHVGNGPARYPQHETSSNIVYFYNCKVFGLQSHHNLWCLQLKLTKRSVCTCTLSTPAWADGRNLVILAEYLVLRYCFSKTLITYWSKNELDITVWKHTGWDQQHQVSWRYFRTS